MNNQAIAEIDAALQEQNLQLALSKVQALIREDAENTLAYIRFGDIFMSMANYPMAVQKYQQALHLEPVNAEIYCRLGEAYAEQNDWALASSNFKSASNIEKQNLAYLGRYGWAQWNLGKKENNQQIQEEAFQLLYSLYDQGVQTPMVKDTIAEYFIINAKSSWPYSAKENCVFATHLKHLQNARKNLDRANQFLDDLSSPLHHEIKLVHTEVDDQEKREFNGYPFMRRAPIIAGVFYLIFGNPGMAIFLFVLAALYHFSQFKPGYLANRQYIKGDYGEPFWVRRINGVGEFFSNFTVFGSFTDVLFMTWIIKLFVKIMQYLMALVILPFLIVSGFVTNYDLIPKARTWIANQKQLQ